MLQKQYITFSWKEIHSLLSGKGKSIIYELGPQTLFLKNMPLF
jgi:hypothetical protein